MDRIEAAPFTSTGPHGHRMRMRTRLLAGPGALADYEILEMLLFLGIERRDTKPQAKGLINNFGNLAGTITAGPDALARAGLPRRAAEALALVEDATGRLARAERNERVNLGDWAALARHLDLPARARQNPGRSVLLLNNRNQLLAEHRFPPGADAETVGRDLLRQALDRHATAAILVRNAAGETPALTAEDQALHAQLAAVAGTLSILLHDTVVAGAGEWVSLRLQRARR